MPRRFTTGIDIGTHHVKVLIAEQTRSTSGRSYPQVIGTGVAESHGLRHGYIINTAEVAHSISQALKQAQKQSGQRIEEVFLAIGGVSLESVTASGIAVVSRGDNEITETDTANALSECEASIPSSQLQNRKIIHSIPLEFKIDGQPVLGSPLGMKGMKIEARSLFVTALESHVNDLIDVVEDLGVAVVDVMASPLAAGLVSLSKNQKVAGCVLANIGAETVSLVVYEDNLPISLEVFSLGSTDITNDIALGLKIPLEEAQQIKHGNQTGINVSKKQLDEIIAARLSDIFELIEAHLKKIKRNKLLPAGVIITGGGSRIASVSEMAKTSLELPARVASVEFTHGERGQVQDARWAVAYGLCLFGFSSLHEDRLGRRGIFKGLWRKSLNFLKQFLP